MTTIRDILPLVETGYRNNGLRSLSSLHNNARHVNDALGDRRAESITSMDISWYVQHRLNQGAANASINRELVALKRAYSLARKAKLIKERPRS